MLTKTLMHHLSEFHLFVVFQQPDSLQGSSFTLHCDHILRPPLPTAPLSPAYLTHGNSSITSDCPQTRMDQKHFLVQSFRIETEKLAPVVLRDLQILLSNCQFQIHLLCLFISPRS